jgi:hypothetical protein
MVVVPARYSVLQVSFDLLRKRDMVLVAYQGEAGSDQPLLHAWDGREWVHISMDSYAAADFLQVRPTQVVLVGDEALLPAGLYDVSSWCGQVMNIPSIDTATLVNAFGKLFDFQRREWAWFAGRYNLDLDDLNESRRKSSWYDRPHVAEPIPRGSFRSPRHTATVPEKVELPPSKMTLEVEEISAPVAADIPPATVLPAE